MKNLFKKLNVSADRADDANSSSGEALPIKLLNSVISAWLSDKKTTSQPFQANSRGSGQDESRLGLNPSWDPKLDEEQQLQLALELSAKEDPEAVQIETVKQISASSSPAEMVTYRYWNYSALSYEDKIFDGFYDLYGLSSESDIGTWEAVIVDTIADTNLKKLKEKTKEMTANFQINSEFQLARSIANLVSEYMGGVVRDEQSMRRALQSLSYSLKTTLGSVVLPLGCLTLGLSRHRALLYKVLADSAGLPCRITKGCQYDEAMCFVKIEDGREFIVDLTNNPDNLTPVGEEPKNSSAINSDESQQRPLLRSASWSEGISSRKVKAKDVIKGAKGSPKLNSPKNQNQLARVPVKIPVAAAAAAVVASSIVVAAVKSNPSSSVELPVAAATAAAVAVTTAAANSLDDSSEGERLSERSSGNESARSEMGIEDVEEIHWEEIVVGERIGIGSCGEVYRGEWRNTEVAVKRFLDQDITGEGLAEFISEVKIMQKLRHPNVILFMGAVTRPPNLSIVTEYLARGSLYRLLHRPNNHLDHRRRIKMALDTARGMNYLHSCCPVIVHRDLKSPNLLVDRNWAVKVCDFGLSRTKHNTFLSSRSTAGTAEWMAPEVLRNEPSDEKCDVYSFGVILWELCTMQRPWWGMNPMQVVGAVGFQNRRLDIPVTVDSDVADVISKCWQNDPKLRPSFPEIIGLLKPIATSKFSA